MRTKNTTTHLLDAQKCIHLYTLSISQMSCQCYLYFKVFPALPLPHHFLFQGDRSVMYRAIDKLQQKNTPLIHFKLCKTLATDFKIT